MDSKLERSLDAAGFTLQRMQFHISLVDLYEKHVLLNMAHPGVKAYICGSFGEAWGFNLSCMDGQVSNDSDVDITIIDDSLSHFVNCSCYDGVSSGREAFEELGEGHCIDKFPDQDTEEYLTSSPALKYPRTASQPSRDSCFAYQTACIPKTCTLFKNKNINQQLQEACRDVGVHIVKAQRPGHEGEERRISYSLMERILVRNFPIFIGRAFLMIKFLFKRILPSYGLKSYMAKTLLFNIMHMQFTSSLQAAMEALKVFNSFITTYNPQRQEVCMPHFFQDAPIFFKRPRATGKWPDKKRLSKKIEEEISMNMKVTVDYFIQQLQDAPKVYFSQYQSFLRTPLTNQDNPLDDILENIDSNQTLETIEALPKNLSLAKRCLKVLCYYLKSDLRSVREELSKTIDEVLYIPVKDNLNYDIWLNGCQQWILPVSEKNMKQLPKFFRGFKCSSFSDSYSLINFKALWFYLHKSFLKCQCGTDYWQKRVVHDYLFTDMQDLLTSVVFETEEHKVTFVIDMMNKSSLTETEKQKMERLIENRQMEIASGIPHLESDADWRIKHAENCKNCNPSVPEAQKVEEAKTTDKSTSVKKKKKCSVM